MTKKQREQIAQKTNGRCAYCGIELPKRWHKDHIEPIRRDSVYVKGRGFVQNGEMKYPENNNLDNMIASCPSCNIEKRSYTLEQFRENIKDKIRLLNKIPTYRIAKRYGLVEEKNIEVKFYFEELIDAGDEKGQIQISKKRREK